MKLTQEDKECISDLVSSGQWMAVLRLCDVVVQKQQERLLQFDVSRPGREMLLLKARIDGAQGMREALANVKKMVKDVED